MPPSDTESAIYTDSDGESSRSIPPRFLLRFPDGREERLSDYSGSPRDARSRATSGPVNNYGHPSSHHHSHSLSMHPTSSHHQAHGRVSGPLFRPHSSNADTQPQEEIRIQPPQQLMTPGTAVYTSSRSAQVRHSGIVCGGALPPQGAQLR